MGVPLEAMRQLVHSGSTRALSWRLQQLDRLGELLQGHQEALIEALASDLGKPRLEATLELSGISQELSLTRRQLRRWMAPQPLSTALFLQPARAQRISEPLGCVLIIGPWNYPIALILQPLISALAAGNSAVLKPSELAPASSNLIATAIAAHYPPEVVSVVQGDGDTAAALLEQPFDHIVFTGSARIGQRVMQAASRHLTPVTLELGGQSPAIVLADAPPAVTARRLIWGKGFNAGQTCVAPNHLLVERSIAAALIADLVRALPRLYGEDPLHSPDLARIVNPTHFARLDALLQQARAQDRVLAGGRSDPEQLRIEPTVVRCDSSDDPLLLQEIFGPILPVLEIDSLAQALALIAARPKPLALYLFSDDRCAQQQTLAQSSSGSLVFNDVILQVADANLPFGGVGGSGMGAYHGEVGFRTLSHQRTVLGRAFWADLPLRYPPYAGKLPLLQRLLG